MAVKVQHRKGAWWIVIHHAGRRKMKRIGDRETALRVAQGIRERLARNDLQLTPSETTPTLRTYVDAWLKTARVTLKASTVEFYNGHLALHILPALGSRQVGSLRRADCRELVTQCRAKGLKATTVRGIARTLRMNCCLRIRRSASAGICGAPTIPNRSSFRSPATKPRTWLPSRGGGFPNGAHGCSAACALVCAPVNSSPSSGVISIGSGASCRCSRTSYAAS